MLQQQLARAEAASRAAEASVATERAAASRALTVAQQKLGAAGQRLTGMSHLVQEKEQLLEEVRTESGGEGEGRWCQGGHLRASRFKTNMDGWG